MKELIFATGNSNKVSEVQMAIPDSILVKSLSDIEFLVEIPETTRTISGNAKQKADFVFHRLKRNVFAEDTGLEVDALDGEPGVDTAYYSGSRNAEKNMDLLLSKLEGIDNRNAQFRTVIALHLEGEFFSFEGILKGTIAKEKLGNGGFGYDPIFIPQGYKQTLAQISPQEKNQISHRGKAIRKLIAHLNSMN